MAACPCGVRLSQPMRLLFLQWCMIVALAELAWSASAVEAAVAWEGTNVNLRKYEELSIRVEGKVHCDWCVLNQDSTEFSKSFLAGVTAALECKNKTEGASYMVAETTTDERGHFIRDVLKSVRNLDDPKNAFTGVCSVRLVSNPHTACNSLVTVSSNLLSFRSFRGILIEYSAGEYSYYPPSLLSLSSRSSHPSDTATASSTSKPCNRGQAVPSMPRKLLSASSNRQSDAAVKTESLTLGPPDPAQPNDVSIKTTSSLGPPSPFQSRHTP